MEPAPCDVPPRLRYGLKSIVSMNDTEPKELRNWQKSQAALQLAEAIDAIAAIAREQGFRTVGVMLDMAKDLARAEHAEAEQALNSGRESGA